MNHDKTIKSFYIAGAYGRKAEFKNYATHLRMNGIAVTASWLEQEAAVDVFDEETLAPEGVGAYHALQDISDIRNAEGFLFFSSADHDVKGRGGRHTEFGIAWDSGRQVFLIGRPEHVFHAMVREARRFDTYHEFFDAVVKK
jgi:hypothetical protein